MFVLNKAKYINEVEIRSKMNFIFFILMLLSTAGLITANILKIAIATIIFKCLSSLFFIATAVSSYKKNSSNTNFFVLMLLGLVFSLGGDVFLVFDIFIFGVASFGIGHIMYSVGYCKMTKISLGDILIFLVIIIPTLLTISFGKFEFNGMKIPVTLYAIIISFMVSKSLSMLKFYSSSKKPVLLMISGSVLFLISDWILLFLFFYPNASPVLGPMNSILYYVGQGLIGLNFSYELNHNEEEINAERLAA